MKGLALGASDRRFHRGRYHIRVTHKNKHYKTQSQERMYSSPFLNAAVRLASPDKFTASWGNIG